MNNKVSIIIPTYNRFNLLLNAIKSVKNQTYKNIEIIVVNDGSSQKEYKQYNFKANNVKIIHLNVNSKTKFGYSNLGYVRNAGIKIATGKYIAFLDDDDYWLPKKLEIQLLAITKTKLKMCATNGLCNGWTVGGKFEWSKLINKKYRNIYNYKQLLKKYSKNFYNDKFKNYFFIEGKIMRGFGNNNKKGCKNCFISSSVLVERKLLEKIGNYSELPTPGEDFETWLLILKKTKCVIINKPLVYYDTKHGMGRHWVSNKKSRWCYNNINNLL